MLNSQSMLLKRYDYCKPHAKISSYDQFAAKSVKAISLSETKSYTHRYSHPAGWTSYLHVCMYAADDARKQRKHKKVAIFRPARQDYTET